MPSRPLIAAIVLFWLAANGWLFYREVLPRWDADEPPRYTIDLTEEVSTGKLGTSTVNWVVLQKGKRVGIGASQVARLPDRTFELRSQFRFERLYLFLVLDVQKMTSTYHVTEDGRLLDLNATVLVRQLTGKQGQGQEMELEMRGTVEDGAVEPRLFLNQAEFPTGMGKVPVSDQGNMLNPMHLVNRLPGLHVGRRWRVPLFDPLGGDPGKFFGTKLGDLVGAGEDLTVPVLEAEVKADTLTWAGKDVPCFKIEYRRPGEPAVVASTWARRSDGLVLQQQARHQLIELTLQRMPNE